MDFKLHRNAEKHAGLHLEEALRICIQGRRCELCSEAADALQMLLVSHFYEIVAALGFLGVLAYLGLFYAVCLFVSRRPSSRSA